MFIGHFALGFAAKPAVPRVSLAALMLAALFADVLWPILVLAGLEEVRIAPGNTAFTPLEFVSYPWSHSLLLLVVWGACVGSAYRVIFGGRRTFVILALLVVSHWVLDWVTHAPDMPLYPRRPESGPRVVELCARDNARRDAPVRSGAVCLHAHDPGKRRNRTLGIGLPRCYPRRDLRARRALRDAAPFGVRDLRGCPGGVGGVHGLGLVDGQA
jgi:hypothetical protein